VGDTVASLVQKALFEPREFHLPDDTLRFVVKDSDGAVEQFVPDENITEVTRRMTSRRGTLRMATVLGGARGVRGRAAHSSYAAQMNPVKPANRCPMRERRSPRL
jgi:hypothetical protein